MRFMGDKRDGAVVRIPDREEAVVKTWMERRARPGRLYCVSSIILQRAGWVFRIDEFRRARGDRCKMEVLVDDLKRWDEKTGEGVSNADPINSTSPLSV